MPVGVGVGAGVGVAVGRGVAVGYGLGSGACVASVEIGAEVMVGGIVSWLAGVGVGFAAEVFFPQPVSVSRPAASKVFLNRFFFRYIRCLMVKILSTFSRCPDGR